jgi:hypothetical protein
MPHSGGHYNKCISAKMPIMVAWHFGLHNFVNHIMVLGWLPTHNIHKNYYENWLTVSDVETGCIQNDNSQTGRLNEFI